MIHGFDDSDKSKVGLADAIEPYIENIYVSETIQAGDTYKIYGTDIDFGMKKPLGIVGVDGLPTDIVMTNFVIKDESYTSAGYKFDYEITLQNVGQNSHIVDNFYVKILGALIEVS